MKIKSVKELSKSKKRQKVECIKDFYEHIPDWLKEQEGITNDFDIIYHKGKIYNCSPEMKTLSGAIIRYVYSDMFNPYYEHEHPGTFPKYQQRITQKFYVKQPDTFFKRLEEHEKLVKDAEKVGGKALNMLKAIKEQRPKPFDPFDEYFKQV